VVYTPGTTAIGGLSARTYYAIPTNGNEFQLASSAANAIAGIALPLSSSGSGVQTFTAQAPSISMTSLTNAITINSRNRAELGSRLNTLSYAIDSLETMSSNLSEAYSRIVDTDYAAETANLTRNKILQEAAAAILAQANQAPNIILSLLDSQSSSSSA
jgi:flagellin